MGGEHADKKKGGKSEQSHGEWEEIHLALRERVHYLGEGGKKTDIHQTLLVGWKCSESRAGKTEKGEISVPFQRLLTTFFKSDGGEKKMRRENLEESKKPVKVIKTAQTHNWG